MSDRNGAPHSTPLRRTESQILPAFDTKRVGVHLYGVLIVVCVRSVVTGKERKIKTHNNGEVITGGRARAEYECNTFLRSSRGVFSACNTASAVKVDVFFAQFFFFYRPSE